MTATDGAASLAADRAAAAEKAAAAEEAAAAAGPRVFSRRGPSIFPLSAVVGQEAAKTALLLCAVNPSIGGVVIGGSRGTCKSVLAKAIHAVLPPIEVVKDSPFNIDPSNPQEIDEVLRQEIEAGDKEFATLETEIIESPFVQIPLDVMEDRLLGSVDVEKSVQTGETVFEPGLLAKAHRGVLYVDDINLLDEQISNQLLSVISQGEVVIEREGVSMRHPCRPLMIATFNPEEAELRDHLLDRIGVALNLDNFPLNEEQRIEAGMMAEQFADFPKEMLERETPLIDEIKTRILFAREYLKDLQLKPAQTKYLVEEAVRAGCQGHRAELFAREVGLASAALEGHDVVEADDLTQAVKLCIIPRGTTIEMPPDDEMQQPPPPPPPPPQMEEEDDQEMEEEPEDEPEQEEPDQEESPDDEIPPIPEEFMIDAEGVCLDPEVMNFALKTNSGKSGGRGLIFSEDRGRYIKPMLPKGKVRRLAVDGTMRAAAPYQKTRRERAAADDTIKKRPVYIEQGDVRVKRMARKAGSLIIFVVDASGSMALNRMNAAKGAAVSLLQTAYQSRDKIALIPFQGDRAEVLLPPTKSITMAKNRLERMPCGGGSPLAHALTVAATTGLNAQKSGDVGSVVVICISDGRANVPLSTSMGEVVEEEDKFTKEQLKEEVLATARKLGCLTSFKLLMLDTENKFVSTGIAKDIADAAQGRYHYIPKATAAGLSGVASAALADLKNL